MNQPTKVPFPAPILAAGTRLVTSAFARHQVADYGDARAAEAAGLATPQAVESAPREPLLQAVDYAIHHGWPADSLKRIASIREADQKRTTEHALTDTTLTDEQLLEIVTKHFGYSNVPDLLAPRLALAKEVAALATSPAPSAPASQAAAVPAEVAGIVKEAKSLVSAACGAWRMAVDSDDANDAEDTQRRAFAAIDRLAAATQARAPASLEPVAQWGYAKTVGNAIAQLKTLDPESPIYGAMHLDDGRCIARGLTFSRERVVGERWIENANADVPYSIVAWSHTKDPADRLAEPQALPASGETRDGWQPIETAPKTGRTILLGYFNALGKWRTLRGKWFSDAVIQEEWTNSDVHEAGWFETSVECDEEDNGCWPCDPTHWMPLPAAPTTTQEKKA